MVGLPTGIAGGFNVSQIIGFSVLIVSIFIMGLITILTMFVGSFNVKVDIIEQFGNGVFITPRRAKRIQKLAGNSLKFLFWKKECPLPSGKYFMPMGKKKFKLNMYQDINGNLNPVELRFDADKNPLFVPDDSDKRFWLINRLDENKDNYKAEDFWSRYKDAIIFGGVICASVTILIIYGYYFFNGINTIGASLASTMADLSKSLHTISPQLQYQYVQLPNPMSNVTNIGTNPVAILNNTLSAIG